MYTNFIQKKIIWCTTIKLINRDNQVDKQELMKLIQATTARRWETRCLP